MKELIALIFSICMALTTVSQEKLFETYVELNTGLKERGDAYQILDDQEEELSLFIIDTRKVYGFLLSDTFTAMTGLIKSKPDRKLKQITGGFYANDQYNLILSNDRQDHFGALVFDYNNNVVNSKPIALELKKEKLIEAFNIDNHFHLLTIKKNSSFLKLYRFNSLSDWDITEYDLSDVQFDESNSKLFTLLFQLTANYRMEVMIAEISGDHPNSPGASAIPYKIYPLQGKIYITLDHQVDLTKVIKLDINEKTFTVNAHVIRADVCADAFRYSSNSFIHEDILYQTSLCIDGIYLSLTDLNTGRLIKTLSATGGEDIHFSNTPLVRERQHMDTEISETKKFLKKLTSNVGISVFRRNENLELTIGGYKEQTQVTGAGTVWMPMTSMTGAGPITTYHFIGNPFMYGIKNYDLNRVAYFKSVLDNDFNHVEGEITDNAFDQITKILKRIEYDSAAETVFKKEDDFILGYFLPENSKYYLFRFRD